MSEKVQAQAKTKKKKMSFEEAFEGLEHSVSILKSEDASLEMAIKQYEQGLEFYESCEEILSDAKQKIEVYKADEEAK